MTSDARNGVLIPFDVALGDAIRLFPFGSRRPTFFRRDFILDCSPSFRPFVTDSIIGVNSYWAQGLKPPTFMIMGLAYMTSPPPHFCDVIFSKLCFNCSHWFYAMPTNPQLDHSFPAVLDIFGKGLNLPAPLDIQ